jgi:hypothetical protein
VTVGGGPDLPSTIACQPDPQLVVAVSTDPKLIGRAPHEETLKALFKGFGWNYADNRSDTLALLRDAKAELVYFYCHGGVHMDRPWLQVGPPNERVIDRGDFRREGIKWTEPQPLVFINGCHTTALTPERAIEFVSALMENAQASGVIGTEITVFEPLATEFAHQFLPRFLAGVPAGEAIRSSRLVLLKNGNPLGLVYIPFVLASLQVTGSTLSWPTTKKSTPAQLATIASPATIVSAEESDHA